MEHLVEYYHTKWGVPGHENDFNVEDLVGADIRRYISDAACITRGLNNVLGTKLEGYENAPFFPTFKRKYLETGRLPACETTDRTQCAVLEMMLTLTGVCINFVVQIRSKGVDFSVQQCLGTDWMNFFRTNFLTYSDLNDHYSFRTEKLPTFCRLPANNGRTIFRQPNIHRDILLKKKSSFEIKPSTSK